MTSRDAETTVVVAARDTLADGVAGLTLRQPDGGPLPAWEPGAHLDLLLESGLERQYSLCGDPADRHAWRVAVLLEPGGRGGSAQVHDLRPGARLTARGPRNHFPLVPAARYLFIAGGIGITPIVPMVAAARAAGAEWHLLYGGRRRRSMAFLGELAALGDRVAIRPQDETGLLDLAGPLAEPRDGTAVYCCGPEPLLAAVEERCAGWPRGALHLERFAPKPLEAGREAGLDFEVELARSGLTVTVSPGTSVLQAVEEAGVAVLSSCREGTCGTCETTVLEGVPDHRDSVLTDEERGTHEFMMICVSRARGSRLVLDL